MTFAIIHEEFFPIDFSKYFVHSAVWSKVDCYYCKDLFASATNYTKNSMKGKDLLSSSEISIRFLKSSHSEVLRKKLFCRNTCGQNRKAELY